MENLQAIYEQAYNSEWERRKGTSALRVVEVNSGRVYEKEGNFFLCGFTSLRFWYRAKNKELKKLLAKQKLFTKGAYGGGLRFYLEEVGNKGNGDFEIQKYAYQKVADYLNGLGYRVYVEANLD